MFSYSRLTDPSSISRHLVGCSGPTVLDVETTDKDPTKAELIDIQVGTPYGIICFDAQYAGLLLNLCPTVRLVGQNLGYDLHVLYRHGVNLLGRPWRDTMLLHHLVDEVASHSLDAAAQRYWGDAYKTDFWATYDSYLAAPQVVRDEYACKDIYYTAKWYDLLQAELFEQGVPTHLIRHVHRLARQLLNTEILGVRVDKSYLMERLLALSTTTEGLKPRMRELVDAECQIIELQDWVRELDKRKTDRGKARVPRPIFNFDSQRQLAQLLYKQLKLPEQVNDKTKRVTTEYDALERLREHHSVVPLIQEYREHGKTVGTLEGILERMVGDTIYPTFKVNGTKTGRISHTDPNMGNMPSHGGIRGLFIPDPGCVIVSADYSGLEVVVEANLTNDKNLARILNEGISKHDITAKELGIDRDIAKRLNFACQYWCTPYMVAKILGTSMKEGEAVHRRYWDIYSGPKLLKEATDRELDSQGYVTNFVGRRRRFGVAQRGQMDKAYRAAYNFKIQGPGADFTNEASYLMGERLEQNKHGRFLFSVHDELLICVKREHAEEEEKALVQIMEGVSDTWKLKYRLKAVSSGPCARWED